jgi:hypothetical protein
MTNMVRSENEMSPAMNGEAQPVLEVVALTKRYGDQSALSDVGFTVQASATRAMPTAGPRLSGFSPGVALADPSRMVTQPPPPTPNPAFIKEVVMNNGTRVLSIIAVSTIVMLLPAFAAVLKVDLANETVGAEPKALVPMVGIWRIENEGGKKVLAVDGRQWKEGQSSAGIADKARALYGERYAEFLDRVQAYAYYPYVVAKDVENFKNGEITVRFECLSGRIDQGAGILFNLKPNGDYLTVRANCLENNLVLWKFERGRRSQVEWVRNTPTASRQWHDLKVRIAGNKVESYLDGKLYLQHTLPEPVSGRIGLWSKADSYMHFDDFVATASE